MVIEFDSKVSIPADVMIRQVGGESVLLNLTTERYFGLDGVATRMWEVLTESDSVGSAYAILAAEFDVDGDQLRRDLEEFLRELLELGIIQLSNKS